MKIYSTEFHTMYEILKLSYIGEEYIKCNLQDCIEFTIKKGKYNEIDLSNLTTKCSIKNIKTKELLFIMDKLAILFKHV